MSDMQSPVAVVIVHWRQPDRCLLTMDRFAAQDLRGGTAPNLIVVDNGAPESDIAKIAAHPCQPLVLCAGRNTGFGPGLNIGMRHWLRHGRGEWVVLSPHDALLEEGGIQKLIDLAESRERAGVVCADVGDQATPQIDPFLGAIPGPPTVRAGWEPAHYPHGTLIMCRREMLLDIGLFDERYFAYNDEAELGIRARAKGWEVGLARGVMVENPTTSTGAPVIDYLRMRNTIMMQHDHFGRWAALFRVVIGLGNVVHATVRPSIRPPWFTGPARVLAIRDALLQRWGPPPEELG